MSLQDEKNKPLNRKKEICIYGDEEIEREHCKSEVANTYINGKFPGQSRFLVSVENSDGEARVQLS